MRGVWESNTSLRKISVALLLILSSVASANDTTPPNAQLTQPTAAQMVNSPVSINGTATDAVGVNYVWLTIKDTGSLDYWQNGTWSTGYQQLKVPVSPAGGTNTTWTYQFQEGSRQGSGSYQASVAAVDTAGNVDPTKATVTFTVSDKVAPDTTITTPIQAAKLTAPVAAAGRATDGIGVDFVWITVRDLGTLAGWTGAGWSDAFVRLPVPVSAPGQMSTVWSYHFDPSGSGGSGNYQLSARAQDTSKNADASAAQVWFSASDSGSSSNLP